ncbi:plant invertase/pectin methylesterase inhibitor [Striga asiatica]|uniref:Plant invertase/pectin methylesterase inhibitor n=1 Tax=Striga asiatica TaxID=4170 RepID=A0A5A7PPQ9_STRAF|nr:plant invertase/pectin methylesterase inhibitor [Striga asiatica]
MEYGRLGYPEPGSLGSSFRSEAPIPPNRTKIKPLLILAALLIIAAASAAAVAVAIRSRDGSSGAPRLHGLRPSEAVSRACGLTSYPSLCLSSLAEFPGAAAASSPAEIVHISVNLTLQKFGGALYAASEISHLEMDPRVRSAYEACIELLDDSVDLLSRSLAHVAGGRDQDVMTWLSASLTNHDTCEEGFEELGGGGGEVKGRMSARLKDLSELVSNCLAIYAQIAGGGDFSGIPVNNRRRRLLWGGEGAARGEFPSWVSRRDRRLLDAPPASIRADVVVSKDGNGTCRTVEEAIKMAPENSTRRFIIYVRAGR